MEKLKQETSISDNIVLLEKEKARSCTACGESDKKIIFILFGKDINGGTGAHLCNNCFIELKEKINDFEYKKN